MKRKVDPMAGLRLKRHVSPLIVASVLALWVLSGCASVVTFVEGGRFAILTAGALGVPTKFITTWDTRKLPDGTWRWKAYDALGGTYVCVLAKSAQAAQCSGPVNQSSSFRP